MKRKFLSMLLVAAMCTSMMGTVCFAAGGELDGDDMTGATITGDATVENPVYKVVVPTDLTFAIDPFEQKGSGSQIFSEDFSMINKSNVAVRVNAAVTVAGKDSTVTLKTTEADVKEDDSSKQVYIAVQVPSAVAGTAAAAAKYPTSLGTDSNGDYYDNSLADTDLTLTEVTEVVDVTGVTGTYTTSAKVALDAEGKANCLFALDKAVYTEYYSAKDKSTTAKQFKTCAASEAGVATFRFTGKVNSKAAWAAGDVTASVTYTFIGLSGDNYTALLAKNVENTHAYVVEDADPTFDCSEVGVITYTTGGGTLALDKITKMEAVYAGKVFNFYTVAGTKDENSKVTVDAAYMANYAKAGATVEATVTYLNKAGDTKTAKVTLLCRQPVEAAPEVTE